MSQSKGLVTEYNQLKSKLQVRIRELQTKCLSQNKTLHSFHQIEHEYGHHHYHCNPHCHSKNTTLLMNGNQNEASSASPQQLPIKNSQITDAYLKMNLRLQRDMHQNLQTLNQCILNLSHKKSDVSAFQNQQSDYSELRKSKKSSNNSKLTHSQYDSQNPRINSLGSRSSKKINLHQRTSNHKVYNSNFSKFRRNNSQSNNSYPKQQQPKQEVFNCDREYFVISNKKSKKTRCPQHEAKKMKIKYTDRSGNREIYKDSVYRHKKHERDHLTNSYSQQQKSRRQLLAIIAENFYNNYGTEPIK